MDVWVLDTICVDEQDCALFAGTFNLTSAFSPRAMTTMVANPSAPATRVAS